MLIIAGIVAALLTFFDLDRTFYIPKNNSQRLELNCWYYGFILANGVLASLLYSLVSDNPVLANLPKWLGSFLVGIAYLAIVRIKFATLKVQDKEVPLGIELLYEAARTSVYKRINKIAKAARYEEALQIAENQPIEKLKSRALLSIQQDALLSDSEKERAYQWINKLIADKETKELQKRMLLADFIVSGFTN